MRHRSPQAVKAPHDQCIFWLQHGKARLQAGPVGASTRGLIDENMGRLTPRLLERVHLKLAGPVPAHAGRQCSGGSIQPDLAQAAA